MMVNEAFAKQLAGEESVVGRSVKFSSPDRYTIIGVIRNFKMQATVGMTLPMVFHNPNCSMKNDTTTYSYKVHVKLKEMNQEGIEAVNECIRKRLDKPNLAVTTFEESRLNALR